MVIVVNYLDDRVQFWHGTNVPTVRLPDRSLRMEDRFLHNRLTRHAVVFHLVGVRV